MEKRKFKRININAPGRINLRLGGRFQEVAIDNLNDDQLAELYDNGCPYVCLVDPPIPVVTKKLDLNHHTPEPPKAEKKQITKPKEVR
jgi:hypothetical protein